MEMCLSTPDFLTFLNMLGNDVVAIFLDTKEVAVGDTGTVWNYIPILHAWAATVDGVAANCYKILGGVMI